MKIQDLRGQTMGGASKRNTNQIKKIARHHSATTTGTVFVFERHWRTLGWNTGGYHEVILRDGTVQICYDPNVVTNGVKNHNTSTYHICLVGNGSFTKEQEDAFEKRALLAMERFKLKVSDVLGHREFSGASTACPGINMNNVRQRLTNALKPKAPVTQPKPEVKQTKEEPFLLKKAIVINTFADYPAAERLANKLRVPIYTRATAERSHQAKELIICGGFVGKLKADKITDLSGKTLFDTYANVGKRV